ncbi:hypothetical protein [Deinococcus radiotolerans]|nr:hypothetical protein [Deinococcus radiotolerans]
MISDDAIRARLGEQASSDREVQLMRDLLQEHAAGQSPDALSEEEWLRLVGLMEARKLQGDPNMK